jgi:hypothetical protein
MITTIKFIYIRLSLYPIKMQVYFNNDLTDIVTYQFNTYVKNIITKIITNKNAALLNLKCSGKYDLIGMNIFISELAEEVLRGNNSIKIIDET